MDQFRDIVVLLESVRSVAASNTNPKVRCCDDPNRRSIGFVYGDDPSGPAFTISLTRFKESAHLLPQKLRYEFRSAEGRARIAGWLQEGLTLEQMEQKLPEDP